MLGEVRDWWDEGALGAARAEPARRSIDRNCMLMVVEDVLMAKVQDDIVIRRLMRVIRVGERGE